MSWTEKFTIPGKCLMSNNCRLQTSLSQRHKRRIVMEEFSPELGRAEYIGPFTWFNGVSHLAVRGMVHYTMQV